MEVRAHPSSAAALAAAALREAATAVGSVVRGKPEAVRGVLEALLAGGHVLLEDVPGVGKTTLARALARVLGGTFRRVQFTSDLMPADIIGVNVLAGADGAFRFRPGPVFCHVLLADEVNRATPRTQSALLQAMEERQVTLDGVTHRLPEPFLVLATQNPMEQHGTYPLPESQMDRFLMRLALGYPDRGTERELVRDSGSVIDPEGLSAAMTPALVAQARLAASDVRLDETLLDYLLDVVEGTRRHAALALGASPRAALALARAARARAWLDGRDFVIPDDIKGLAGPVLEHRLVPRDLSTTGAERRAQVGTALADVLARVPVPL